MPRVFRDFRTARGEPRGARGAAARQGPGAPQATGTNGALHSSNLVPRPRNSPAHFSVACACRHGRHKKYSGARREMWGSPRRGAGSNCKKLVSSTSFTCGAEQQGQKKRRIRRETRRETRQVAWPRLAARVPDSVIARVWQLGRSAKETQEREERRGRGERRQQQLWHVLSPP